jgi:hypothetical protein
VLDDPQRRWTKLAAAVIGIPIGLRRGDRLGPVGVGEPGQVGERQRGERDEEVHEAGLGHDGSLQHGACAATAGGCALGHRVVERDRVTPRPTTTCDPL